MYPNLESVFIGYGLKTGQGFYPGLFFCPYPPNQLADYQYLFGSGTTDLSQSPHPPYWLSRNRQSARLLHSSIKSKSACAVLILMYGRKR